MSIHCGPSRRPGLVLCPMVVLYPAVVCFVWLAALVPAQAQDSKVIGPPIPQRFKEAPANGDDHSGHDHSGHDHAGHDHSGHDHAGHDHAGQDHAGQDDGAETVKKKLSPVLPPKDFKPAKAVVAEDRFNFGTVFKGEIVTHKFMLQNEGGSDLLISKVKPGCGCTHVDHDKVIAPGAQGEITLQVDTNRLGAGKIAKYADIHTNDPESAQVRVYIEGTIATAFKVDPPMPRLEVVRGVGSATLDVTLTKLIAMNFQVTEVKTQNDRVTVDLEEKGNGTYILHVAANTTEDNKTSYFNDRVTVSVESDDGKTMSQEIPVTIRLLDRITAKPPRTVYFRRPEVAAFRSGGEKLSKEIIVKSEVPTSNFQITSVEVNNEHFTTRVEPVKEGQEYKVIVEIKKLPEDASVKSLKADLVIETDDEAQPKLDMRVLAFI